MLTLHPPSFIETGGCDGPRYTRGQPNRENPGILMSEIQDKYITEFELPYRNVERYIKEIGNNWNRLNDEQRNSIRKSLKNMKLDQKIETFENQGTESPSTEPPNKYGDYKITDPAIDNFIKFLANDPYNNTPLFMNRLWNSTHQQLGITRDQLYQIKDATYQWSVDNSYTLHCNWRSGLILFFFILAIIVLIIALAMSNCNNSETSKAFGRSLFGNR